MHYTDVIMTTMAAQIPASRLFTQPFIQTQIKENIKAPRHRPLCGEFTGTGEFPAQRASYAKNVSIWWRHHGCPHLRPVVLRIFHSPVNVELRKIRTTLDFWTGSEVNFPDSTCWYCAFSSGFRLAPGRCDFRAAASIAIGSSIACDKVLLSFRLSCSPFFVAAPFLPGMLTSGKDVLATVETRFDFEGCPAREVLPVVDKPSLVGGLMVELRLDLKGRALPPSAGRLPWEVLEIRWGGWL